MAHIESCQLYGLEEQLYTFNQERIDYANQKKLYHIEVELTNRCAAGCSYCIYGCTVNDDQFLEKNLLMKVMDEAALMGIREMYLGGGDPILHPDWYELACYAMDRGIKIALWTGGLLSKGHIDSIMKMDSEKLSCVGIHIDTVNQDAYSQINDYPNTLETKMESYRNLLAAGFPPKKVLPTLTLAKPIIPTIEETIDWFIDEMGACQVILCPIKPSGFKKEDQKFESGLSDIRKAREYLAKKLGKGWLIFGDTPIGTYYCRTNMALMVNGDLSSCGCLYPEYNLGNISKDNIKDVFERNRDFVTFSFPIKGKCGNCENNPHCIGCRGNAYMYLGDYMASDPRCWLNPEAKEYYLNQL
jgi:MoaA/NifB/PqqE/SkfB family radical SAM enzyme